MTANNPKLAYVLHQRPYRETSAIVHLLCDDDHYLHAVCKGVRSQSKSSSQLRTSLQPFAKINIELTGKSDLKNLRKAEAGARPLPLLGKALYSAFYINELVDRISRYEGIAPGLFNTYQQVLKKLAEISGHLASGEVNKDLVGRRLETSLRQFELEYLHLLGYGVEFSHCADSGSPVDAANYYRLDPQRGFILNEQSQRDRLDAGNQNKNLQAIPGSSLLSIAEQNYKDTAVLHHAKLICRELFRPMLGGKPLRSRELFV